MTERFVLADYGRHLIAVEHFYGDGRAVSDVWVTYHWVDGPLPDWLDVASLPKLKPAAIYDQSGKRQSDAALSAGEGTQQ